MQQIHKRFTTEQVKALLEGLCQGTLDRSAVKHVLEIGHCGNRASGGYPGGPVVFLVETGESRTPPETRPCYLYHCQGDCDRRPSDLDSRGLGTSPSP
jgi:hypothetical protein